jgi:exosortase
MQEQLATAIPITRRLNRHYLFFLFWATTLFLFRASVNKLVAQSWNDDRYSYAVLMPFLCLILIWLDRSTVFKRASSGAAIGVPLGVLGGIAYVAVRGSWWAVSPEYALSFEMLAVVIVWLAGFVLCYGTLSFRAAAFPLAVLALTSPLPSESMHFAEIALQKGSAEVAHMLFKVTGMPVFRQGLVFSLPGMDIEVAEECSGIRSSTAFLIMIVVASHLLLRSNWSKALLILLTIPIVIFKNAVRIATLCWLGVYVSPDFLHGDLHKYGGLPFSLIGLALLVPLLIALQRLETAWWSTPAAQSSPQPSTRDL